MDQAPTGHYPIERREARWSPAYPGRRHRPDCHIMLERIVVGEGWACIDLGCGPGGNYGNAERRVGARPGHRP